MTWSRPFAITNVVGDEYDPYIHYDPSRDRLWLTYARWHEGKGGNHNDVVIQFKKCAVCKWSTPVVVAGDGINDYWIPSVLALADGTILTFFNKNGPESDFGVGSGSIQVKRLIDGGVTWGLGITPTQMCDAEYPRAIQNSVGSILLIFGRYVDSSHLSHGTTCSDGMKNGYPYTDIHQVWSSDGGKSWGRESILFHTPDGSALHPYIGAESAQAQVPCATCRWDIFFVKPAKGFAVFRLQSSDQGVSWDGPGQFSTTNWSSPFNVDPGFTVSCKGQVVNFTSGFGKDQNVYVRRDDWYKSCSW